MMTTPAEPVTGMTTKPTLQSSNIKRVQELVAEFQAGRPEGYLAGVSDTFKGSVLAGLIPNGERLASKADFMAMMGTMDQYMEVQKFEPHDWRAVGDDVLFNVSWRFLWKPTGTVVELGLQATKRTLNRRRLLVVDAPAHHLASEWVAVLVPLGREDARLERVLACRLDVAHGDQVRETRFSE